MALNLVVNSEQSLQSAIGELRSTWKEGKYLRVSVRTGKARSLDQNAISHCWYAQIAREDKQFSEHEVKRFCKLHFGVPILRGDDADFREMYDTAILKNLSYEQKLKAMDILPVTSLMTKDQLSKYLAAMQGHYIDQGIDLRFPDGEIMN